MLILALVSSLAFAGPDFKLPPAHDRKPLNIGDAAPDFTGKGSDGKPYTLSKYRGKHVVLEWSNRGCPYVRKHYETGNMQKLQRKWTKAGVVWLTVLSSAKGNQGYVTPEEEQAYLKENDASPTAALLDSEGKIGTAYDAKTTPHVFVINPKGKVIYNGAIDDKPSTKKDDIEGAKNHLDAALTEATAGKPVTLASTPPYGCSVKYSK